MPVDPAVVEAGGRAFNAAVCPSRSWEDTSRMRREMILREVEMVLEGALPEYERRLRAALTEVVAEAIYDEALVHCYGPEWDEASPEDKARYRVDAEQVVDRVLKGGGHAG